jgi:hypothetical protein
MAHVSKKRLNKSALDKIQNLFLEELVRIIDKKEMGDFLGKLLTESEKIMLPKRLSAFVMIDKGIPDIRISNALNLTPETIMRYRLAYIAARDKKEPIAIIVKKVGRKTEMKELLKEILLGYVIPTMLGRIPRKGLF